MHSGLSGVRDEEPLLDPPGYVISQTAHELQEGEEEGEACRGRVVKKEGDRERDCKRERCVAEVLRSGDREYHEMHCR